MIIHSEEVAHRTDFALLCNARGIRKAMEIGTDIATFACDFLRRWEGDELWCVDAYAPVEEFPWSRDGELAIAAARLATFNGRARIVRATSGQAAAALPWWFNPGFIYIDAAHDYESVATDIATWWPRVWDGGILAGHDYDSTHPGVMRAVEEFAAREGVVVRVTAEKSCPSWYAYKVEPERLIRRYFVSDEIPNPHFRAQAYA